MNGRMQIRQATRKAAKLRLGVFGPSGSGKTLSSLRIATGLIQAAGGGTIGVIDTEVGSSELYADQYDFGVINPVDHDPHTYIEALQLFAQAGYNVVIIDSLSHGWEWLKEWVDLLAASKYRGNTWSAWSEGTPRQQALMRAILTYPGHVIGTMRSKTEWTTAEGSGKPMRVGLAPQVRPGTEYDFTLLLEMSANHAGQIIKGRGTGGFQDRLIEKPSEELGVELAHWLAAGDVDEQPVDGNRLLPSGPQIVAAITGPQVAALASELRKIGFGTSDTDKARGLDFIRHATGATIASVKDLSHGVADTLLKTLRDEPRMLQAIQDWQRARGELTEPPDDGAPPWDEAEPDVQTSPEVDVDAAPEPEQATGLFGADAPANGLPKPRRTTRRRKAAGAEA